MAEIILGNIQVSETALLSIVLFRRLLPTLFALFDKESSPFEKLHGWRYGVAPECHVPSESDTAHEIRKKKKLDIQGV